MVEAVGHADGDLDAVVEGLESRVGVAELDRPEDVGTPASDLLRQFDDFGYAAMGRPEHPVFQLFPGLSDGVFEQVAQEFLEPPGAVELPLGVRVPQRREGFVLPFGQVVGVLRYGVFDAAHAPGRLLVAVASRLVPQAFPDLVERVAHPADDVEPVEHALGVRAVLLDA